MEDQSWLKMHSTHDVNILAQRWFPIGDMGVGVLLSSHIGSILGFHWQYWHWLHIGTQ